MTDHDQSRHVVLPRTFQRMMQLRQKVFTLVFLLPPLLTLKDALYFQDLAHSSQFFFADF